jgi:lysophospholipase L1-like esterase
MSRALLLAALFGGLAPPASIGWSSRIRAAVLRVTVLLLVFAASLVTAEYVARFVFRNAHSSGQAGDFVAARGAGPAIVSNRLGFREREIPPKGPDRYRIVVVGDSFTWGQGIEAGERFSNLLEGLLGPGYEVFNFGRPGNNMPEHLDVLEEALPVSPDFILLQLYINDFETRQMTRPRPYPLLPASLDRDLEGSSVLYDLANRRWAGWQPTLGVVDSYEQYMARNLRDANAPNSQRAFGMLREFIERSHRAGVACGIVLFPAADAMGPHGSNYPFGYLHERVGSTCADAQIRCLDLLPAFSTIEDPRSMWVSPFDAHPNAMTNRRAAQAILRQFAHTWQRSTE